MIVGAIGGYYIDDSVAFAAEFHGTPPTESRRVLVDGVSAACPFVVAHEHGSTGLV